MLYVCPPHISAVVAAAVVLLLCMFFVYPNNHTDSTARGGVGEASTPRGGERLTGACCDDGESERTDKYFGYWSVWCCCVHLALERGRGPHLIERWMWRAPTPYQAHEGKEIDEKRVVD